MNSINQSGRIEIHQVPDIGIHKSHVRMQLRAMHVHHFVDALDLEDDAVFNEKVQTVSALEVHTLVMDWNRHLLAKPYFTAKQLVRQTASVRGLQQSWSQGAVHLNGAGDDPMHERSCERRLRVQRRALLPARRRV